MGKKPQRHSWPEAKKLCRLNHDDIAMAKSLSFGPDALIRARPDPRQKWKLPVKDWIRELYFKRFGFVLGQQPVRAAQPAQVEDDEEAARRFAEELYWEDYWERNEADPIEKRQPGKKVPAAGPPVPKDKLVFFESIGEDDIPF